MTSNPLAGNVLASNCQKGVSETRQFKLANKCSVFNINIYFLTTTLL